MQEYWSGLPCPPPGDLPNPGMEPRSPVLQADSLLTKPLGSPRILGWVTYPFSRGSSWPRSLYQLSFQGSPKGAPAAAAKSLQLCPTLCNPIDSSPPDSSVPGILQARILEWVAISFSNACMHAKSPQSCPTLCYPMNSSPPGSSAHRILQGRILEWIASSFSKRCP